MKILLSIHPNHMDSIFSGKKKFEFRKIRCRQKVETIVFYVTAPVSGVIGEAEVLNIIEGDVERVWEHTHNFAGISYDFYRKYYKKQKRAIAFELGKVTRYPTIKTVVEAGGIKPPQSFRYL